MRKAVLINSSELFDLRNLLTEAEQLDGIEKQPFVKKALEYVESILVRADLVS